MSLLCEFLEEVASIIGFELEMPVPVRMPEVPLAALALRVEFLDEKDL
jgi:hypothetical protein